MAISTFDIFKIGIGPSSSHTFGPMVAAARFLEELENQGLFAATVRVTVTLYGSLGATGKGHYTDLASQLGLEGFVPATTDSSKIPGAQQRILDEKTLHLGAKKFIPFDAEQDIIWKGHTFLPKHPNGIQFDAYDSAGENHYRGIYFSIGGGFVVGEDEPIDPKQAMGDKTPYPFTWGSELLEACNTEGKTISQIMMANELTWRTEEEIRSQLLEIARVMNNAINVGLSTDGIIPGGLNVRRVAKHMYDNYNANKGQSDNPLRVIELASIYGMANNEVNASLGQQVTAPTFGSAGVIPSVLRCLREFEPSMDDDKVVNFLLTAAAVAIPCKINSTFAGADGGCQAEIGVACAMAAAGACEVMGGTPAEVINAAAFGLEHNLGLTCDPVNGLVQIPCIERNAMAANKAINGAILVLQTRGARQRPTFDEVIKAHWEIAQNISSKYKETATGGLAVSYTEC